MNISPRLSYSQLLSTEFVSASLRLSSIYGQGIENTSAHAQQGWYLKMPNVGSMIEVGSFKTIESWEPRSASIIGHTTTVFGPAALAKALRYSISSITLKSTALVHLSLDWAWPQPNCSLAQNWTNFSSCFSLCFSLDLSSLFCWRLDLSALLAIRNHCYSVASSSSCCW